MNLPHLEKSDATYFVSFTALRELELDPAERTVVYDALLFWDDRRMDLDAAVVMADHAHAILRPKAGWRLRDIMQSVKGYSSRKLNERRNRRGPFWRRESFDHVIRDERSWLKTIRYVRDNPVRGKLAATWQDYPWLYLSRRAREVVG